MNFADIIEELRESGYSINQTIAYMKKMYGLHLNIMTIAEFRKFNPSKITELQNRGNRQTQKLLEVCPEEVLYKYYNDKSQIFDRKKLKKDFNFTNSEITVLIDRIHGHNNQPRISSIDRFSIKVTKEIFEADEYKCRRCGRGEEDSQGLVTHHIIPGGGEHFLNGITLCKNCHRIIHVSKCLPKRNQRTNRKNWDTWARRNKLTKK